MSDDIDGSKKIRVCILLLNKEYRRILNMVSKNNRIKKMKKLLIESLTLQ